MTEAIDFTTAFVDTAGYEELRKHVRESTEFTKEIAIVLEERAKVEMNYAKLLNALTAKAKKVTKTNSGTLSAAWSILCGQFDSEATIHKTLAETILRDIHKPLKRMVDQQAKSSKVFESPVDKALKSVNDSRSDLMKKKKSVFSKSRESQSLVNQLGNPNNAKGKPISDKDKAKMKSKSQKSEEAVAKSEAEYLKQLLAAERSRQQHEVALVGAASTVQKQEMDRINQQKGLLGSYTQAICDTTPKIQTCCDGINRALGTVVADADVIAIAKAKGKPPQPTYQVLMDSYQEDMSSVMSINERKEYVKRQVRLIDDEINREMKKQEDLMKNFRNSSTKGSKDGKVDLKLQVLHSNDTINMLTASKFKLLASIADMDGQPKPTCMMSQFMRGNRDKSGSMVSTLHYPRASAPNADAARKINGSPSLVIVTAAPQSNVAASAPPVAAATTAVVAHRAPVPPQKQDSFDDIDGTTAVAAGGAAAVGGGAVGPTPRAAATAQHNAPPSEEHNNGIAMCTALYDFVKTEEEHLEIKQGEFIRLLEMDDDGWWKGEVGDRVGIFPASYVEVVED